MRRGRAGVVGRLLTALGLIAVAAGSTTPAASAADCATPVTSLVLYDTTGQFGNLGQRYATMTMNLLSPFGTTRSEPVAAYRAGEMACAAGVVYVGSTYAEPLPGAFLDDVAAGKTPVMWIWENLWQLQDRLPVVVGTGPDLREFDHVSYRGSELSRTVPVESGLSTQALSDAPEVLATATGPNGASRPWATRVGNLTYLAENPLAYITGTDRYLIFNDLLERMFEPDAPERHRALVRFEDISPHMDPSLLKATVDVAIQEKVPFAMAVIPEYHDGKGGPVITLADRPALVRVIKYAVARGGTIVMHGTTHQVDGLNNPYSGETAADYEYFRATIDANNSVVLQGPVPGDSEAKALADMQRGLDEFAAAGLPRPEVITPPHYAASPADYAAMKQLFAARFDRGLYFDGQSTPGATVDPTKFFDQFFAYPVTDAHQMFVVPENLGNESPDPLNNHPERSPDDLVASAKAALVVHDGFAGFFWHPYLVTDPRVGVAHLHDIIRRVRALGYQFVALSDVVPGLAPQVVPPTPTTLASRLKSLRPYHVVVVLLAIWLPLRWWRRNRRSAHTAEPEPAPEAPTPVETTAGAGSGPGSGDGR